MSRLGVTCLALVVLCMGFQSVRLEDVIKEDSGTTTTAEGLLEAAKEAAEDQENSIIGIQRSLSQSHILNVSEPGNFVESLNPAVTNEVDELDEWVAPFNIPNEYAYYLAGHDEENRPIWTMELGKWNLRAILEEGGDKLAAFDKYVQQLAHRMIKSLKTISTPDFPVTELMYLVDFDELQLTQVAHVPTISYLLKISREYRHLLDAHLGGTVIVNTNFVAENLINILRPVFGPLLAKVEVYGNNKASWLPKVLRKFPRDQIPEWYGGTKDFKPVKVYG